MQAPAPLPTLAQWLAIQTWEDTDEKKGANASQKTHSQKEEHSYQFFDRVERTPNLPFMTDHQGWVDNLLARTDTVPLVASGWNGFRAKKLRYRLESELEGVIGKMWDALNAGIPVDVDSEYPQEIANAPWKERAVLSGWGGDLRGIKFDVAAIFQTTLDPEEDPDDTVYLLVEVKTESTMRAEAHIEQSVMPHTDLNNLTPADKMLVQLIIDAARRAQAFTQARLAHCEVVVLMAHNTVDVCQAIRSELFIHGPLYRNPEPGQLAFTPLYAMRVLASAFYHRAWLMRTRGQRAPTIAPTPTERWLAPPAFLTRLKRALSGVWDT
ncbi:hypothetical protein ONZ51_g10733 [Trametes cubensis]|uniref:Uncharacterized protein n=1 Tax=Trametes cubensis TaxID=1111947 RepID=A0AAD7TIW0_9APHY|nr:hypothetical protein ONZ51_g10733 [Trametes cubensis]